MSNDTLGFSKKILISVGIAALLFGSLALFIYGINVFLLVFTGLLFSVFLRGIAGFISKYIPIPTKLAVGITLILLILIIYLFVILLGPSISDGFTQLQKTLPEAFDELKNSVEQYGWGKSLISEIDKLNMHNIASQDTVKQITGIFSTTIGAIVNFFIILIIGIYVSFNPSLYKKGLIKLFSKRKRKRISEVMDSVSKALGWWLVGRIISMSIIGVLTAIGLAILDIPLPVTLGIIAAILTFVPNIGPVISAVPAILIGLIQSPAKAVYVALLYIGIQMVESYLITPMIQKRTVSMPPALLISVQILVGVWLGLFGLFLATPLLVVVIVVLQMLYIEDVLGDKVKVIGEKS